MTDVTKKMLSELYNTKLPLFTDKGITDRTVNKIIFFILNTIFGTSKKQKTLINILYFKLIFIFI